MEGSIERSGFVRPRGFDQTDPYETWLWNRIVSLLGLKSLGRESIDLSWGLAPLTDRPTVVVARDTEFLAQPGDLQHIVSSKPSAPDGTQASLSVDLVSWIGWILSRAEEKSAGKNLDQHGRYQRSSGLSARSDLEHLPIVDLFISRLRSAVLSISRNAGIPAHRVSPWPEGKSLAVCLTHDVDNLTDRSLAYAGRKFVGAAGALAKGNIGRVRRRLSEGIGLSLGNSRNPYWQVDAMAALEDRLGVRSTFFVLPHTSRMVSEGAQTAWRFDVRRPGNVRLLLALADGGWELGLHPTYHALDQPGALAVERDVLRSLLNGATPLRGSRNHFLRFTPDELWTELETAGVEYDSSLGWPLGWGFRSGTTFPYRPYNIQWGREANLWEVNLTLMDVALGSHDEILESVRDLLGAVREAGGCATLLLHPNPPYETTPRQHLRAYEELIQLVSADSVWITTPGEIIDRMSAYEKSLRK